MTTPRPLLGGALLVLLCAGCNCGGLEVPLLDAGIDSGAPDAGTADAGATDAGAADAGPVVLPLFRIGPRSSFQGAFGQPAITGSITLPLGPQTPTDFTGWSISSPVMSGTVAFAPPADDAGLREVGFTVTLSTASSAPLAARELFTAASPDAGTILRTVLSPQGQLHFTLDSSALQALSVSEARAEDSFLAEAYYLGAAPGDVPALDSAVPAVSGAMRTLFTATGRTGLSPSGFPLPGTAVFDAVDQGRATSGLAAPVVTPGASSLHVTEVALPGTAGTLALFVGGRAPQPSMPIPAGTTRAGFFLYSLGSVSEPLFVRFTTADGGHSPASARFQLPEPLGSGPAEPTLALDAGVARACGLTANHHVVFFASSTELAIGFAAAQTDGGCVTLAPVPAVVGLLNAAQVAPDGRVGAPSNTVFP